jgi:PAS domain S-box-containing protein
MKSLSIKQKVAASVALLAMMLIGLVTGIQLHFMRLDIARMLSDQQFSLVSRQAEDLDNKLTLHLDVLTRSAANLPANLLESPQQLRTFYQQRAMLALFDDVLVIGANGQVIADIPEMPGRTQVNAADRIYFQEVIRTGKPVISEPLLGKLRKEPVVNMGAPILDRNGKIIAVLTGVLRLYKDNFLGNLRTAKIGKSGYFIVMTKGAQPVFVMHPLQELILKPRPLNATPATVAALKGFEGTAESVNSRGLNALFSYKSLKTTNWLLIAVLPTQEAFAPIDEARRHLIAIATMIALLVAPLIWLLVFRLLAPLSMLRDFIQRLRASPEQFTALQITGKDEISDLGHAFNLLMQERIAAEASQRESERKLRENMSLIQAVMDSTGSYVHVRDLKGCFLYVNKEYEKVFRLSRESLIGKSIEDIFPPDLAQQYRTNERTVMQTGMVLRTEVAVMQEDGLHTYLVVRSPLFNEIGEVYGACGVGTDITEHKKIEQMKNEFISTVSHELRTPLTSICGSLDLLVSGMVEGVPVHVRSLLEIANNNCERLVRLINDILDIEKIESGGMRFQMVAQRMLPLVEQAIAATQPYAEQFRVNLTLQPDAENCHVMVDADRMIQVIVNLLSNAAKFSPAGAEVEIRLIQASDQVRLTVTDHGEGIPKGFHARIFQKFAQADSSDTREKGGTGLGLSISKAIIEEHNGRIGFHSEPGCGAEFYVELPSVGIGQ